VLLPSDTLGSIRADTPCRRTRLRSVSSRPHCAISTLAHLLLPSLASSSSLSLFFPSFNMKATGSTVAAVACLFAVSVLLATSQDVPLGCQLTNQVGYRMGYPGKPDGPGLPLPSLRGVPITTVGDCCRVCLEEISSCVAYTFMTNSNGVPTCFLVPQSLDGGFVPIESPGSICGRPQHISIHLTSQTSAPPSVPSDVAPNGGDQDSQGLPPHDHDQNNW
jgi:hypothetical protein